MTRQYYDTSLVTSHAKHGVNLRNNLSWCVIESKNDYRIITTPSCFHTELPVCSSRGYFNMKLMGKLKNPRDDGAIWKGPFQGTDYFFR